MRQEDCARQHCHHAVVGHVYGLHLSTDQAALEQRVQQEGTVRHTTSPSPASPFYNTSIHRLKLEDAAQYKTHNQQLEDRFIRRGVHDAVQRGSAAAVEVEQTARENDRDTQGEDEPHVPAVLLISVHMNVVGLTVVCEEAPR
ncbi:hypothetical protein EGM85_12440 [Macrococcus caseolyticus]|nr:hypothetical protein [Macrococcus caseolyticus]RKO09070.1 hypothetical protein D6861_12440 [Macrococcus caseolyticus]